MLDRLHVTFSFKDDESGIKQYQIQIYELYHGTRMKKYPSNILFSHRCFKTIKNNNQLINVIFFSHLTSFVTFIVSLAATHTWNTIVSGSLTSYTWTGLSLRQGALYTVRVAAVNNAGYMSSFETNGVIIDTTPPLVSSSTC